MKNNMFVMSMIYRLTFLLTFFCIVFAMPLSSAVAQTLQLRADVMDSVTLALADQKIKLWGVEAVNVSDPAFSLNARTALANATGSQFVTCEIKTPTSDNTHAQCVNANDLDLGLFMIQQGYVSVDRGAVYSTVFEDPYIQAEIQAQDSGLGIWGHADKTGESGHASQGSLLLVFAFILFLFIVGTFTFLSIVIMRGFRKVIQAQNDNLDMMSRERKLRNKERGVVATMIDAEIKGNKAKIEAYIVVYEEILYALRDPEKTPRYKNSGDIVQKQPALDRTVFDRNTDKIDVLGHRLASDLIHFYARIKTVPEYVNIEPEMALSDAIEIVHQSVERARKLDVLADALLEAFEQSGVLADLPQEE